jgi:hypothetical protein
MYFTNLLSDPFFDGNLDEWTHGLRPSCVSPLDLSLKISKKYHLIEFCLNPNIQFHYFVLLALGLFLLLIEIAEYQGPIFEMTDDTIIKETK